ncbi:hypothetical protein [Natronomonas sp. EA1]|uniref:hypothetical protein n=1 Tax=Natronomonas sp. EA1 TaxID=3421655 RepID=UPI003EB7CE0D
MTGAGPPREPVPDDVILTHAARSKVYRLYPERELKRRLGTFEGELWYEPDRDVYHLRDPDGYVIIFDETERGLVAITQSHQHQDYDGEAIVRVSPNEHFPERVAGESNTE